MRRLSVIFSAGLLMIGTTASIAQTAQQPPAPAPLPVNAPATPSYEYVQQAASMTFDGTNMTVEGLAPATIFFSDRPYRLTGQMDAQKFVDLWKSPNGPFAVDPPNAAVSVLGNVSEAPAIVELTSAEKSPTGIKYGVKVISGKLPDSASNIAIFVDAVHVRRVGPGYYGYRTHPYYHHPVPGPYCYHAPQAPECRWHVHPYHPYYPPYRPYHPYYPYYPYYPHPAAAFAAGAATGAAIASANQPTYIYPIPAGPIPAHCYINSNHTRMICSVPLN